MLCCQVPERAEGVGPISREHSTVQYSLGFCLEQITVQLSIVDDVMLPSPRERGGLGPISRFLGFSFFPAFVKSHFFPLFWGSTLPHTAKVTAATTSSHQSQERTAGQRTRLIIIIIFCLIIQ